MNIQEFIEKNYTSFEIEDKFEIEYWDARNICQFFRLDEEQLDHLIYRTGKECKEIGWKRAFDFNIVKSNGTIKITATGLYLLLTYSCALKKYNYLEEFIPHFSELAIDDLLRYQGFKQVKRKKKLSESNKEFRNEYFENPDKFDSKNYDSDLKVPDLDIEDQSHQFYNKKVVITGSFERFPNRKDMAILIKSVGGDNNTSISRLTDYVIVGAEAGPRKMELIEKHNTTVINEDEFIELFQEQLNE